jgi:hypothetical protein
MGSPRSHPSDLPSGRRPLAACTAVGRSQLAHARTLADSFQRHHPGGAFYLLVADGLPEHLDVGADVKLLGLGDLPTTCHADLANTYQVVELCQAVKPSLLGLLLDRFGETEAVFLDAEMEVMRPLEELQAALRSAAVALTPQTLQPLPFRGKSPSDRDLLLGGAYSDGLIGLNSSEAASAFLRWWDDHLLRGEGRVAGEGPVFYPRGVITPRKWLDLVPTLFPETALLRDATYNVAWWNLHHRLITGHGDEFRSNGRAVAVFHFSGFDPKQPHALTTACQDRNAVVPGSPLAELLERRADRLMRNGYAEVSRWPTEHRTFPNGVFGHFLLRQVYLGLPPEERKQFGSLSERGRAQRFIAWATRFNAAGGALSPFLEYVYRLRADLAEVLPDPAGRDRPAFLEWAATHGARELGYNPDLAHPEGPARSSPCPDITDQQIRRDVRNVVQTVTPEHAKLLVLGCGIPQLEEGLGRTARHFPSGPDGGPAAEPDVGPEAVNQLEAVRASGARYLVLPRTAYEWLERHGELKQHLLEYYRLAAECDACLVYDLAGPGLDRVGRLAGVPRYAPRSLSELQPTPPRCSIVIPVHGKAALTRQCLEVLLSPPYEKTTYEIIVVDDASPDDTPQVLAGYCGRVRVVTHAVNQGFARTCNDGAAAAGGECLVFLNNDTVPQPGWLDALVRYRDGRPRVGAVGSKLLYPTGTVQHAGTIILQDRWPRHVYVGFPADHPAVTA